jgi:hypothetical protein
MLNDVARECSNTMNLRDRSLNLRQTNIGVYAFALAALLSWGATTAQTAAAATQTVEVTGEHRGVTNENLILELDDGEEMTFVVDIPGDKERKWHKDFATRSRITIT